jgi:hypothetical protein
MIFLLKGAAQYQALLPDFAAPPGCGGAILPSPNGAKTTAP